jgi:subtilisin family serine protease
MPTATPTATPVGQTAFTCPSSDSSANSVSRGAVAESVEATRRTPYRGGAIAPASDLLAVTYDAGFARGAMPQIASREQRSGATMVRQFSFSHIGLLTRIVRVQPGQLAAVEGALRAQAGVRSVGRTGYRRSKLSVNGPLLTNDPYFEGFGSSAPLYESASDPGQWDKHAVRLEYAFEYSQSNNGSNKQSANALGSSSVKIAIIDTGEDPTHPELSSKIAYQKCFITDPSNVQSSSNFETDPDGHGTDVSGIAAAATGNGLGFAGSGGKAAIYGYRVFPTPDDNCTNDSTDDPQCSADTGDIASSIEDAVAQGVNVISMSLGGDNCTGGTDPDPTEGNAVADAIAANIIVVAASGNSSAAQVSAPGCDTGVIAAGATGLADGSTNGTGNATGSSSAPNEYVASYSNYGSPGKSVNSASAWGIVAPGGDPNGDTDEDDLHWIENIWTSTPYMANSGDTSFEGSCNPDFDSTSGTIDCRTLIAGTSMSTPAVAGAAALILAVNGSYQSPAAMKTLLCHTADDISDSHEGCGRLDIYRAMATAIGDSSPPGARNTP